MKRGEDLTHTQVISSQDSNKPFADNPDITI